MVSAQADLANAQAVLVNAAATFGRQQELIKTGSTAQAQLDAATATRDSAQARVNQVTAALQKAQEQLGYAVLKSDYDGVVASWSAEVGQVVAPESNRGDDRPPETPATPSSMSLKSASHCSRRTHDFRCPF